MRKPMLYLIISCLMLACSSIKNKQVIEESAALIQEINTLLPSMEAQLEQLEHHANSINIQGRTLTIEEMEATAAISGILQGFHDWKEQYKQVQHRLKNEQVSSDNLLSGYKRAYKELQTIKQRADELKTKI